MTPENANAQACDTETGFTEFQDKTQTKQIHKDAAMAKPKELKDAANAKAKEVINMNLVDTILEYLGYRKPAISLDDEKAIHEGPILTVFLEDKCLCSRVPVRAWMCISSRANTYFSENPAPKEVHLPANSGDESTIARMLGLLNGHVGPVLSLPHLDSLIDRVLVLQAAAALDLPVPDHTIEGSIIDGVRSRFCTWDEMDALGTRFSRTEWIYKEFVRDLCARRCHGRIRNLERFNRFLQEHQRLAADMEDIDAEYATRRQQVGKELRSPNR